MFVDSPVEKEFWHIKQNYDDHDCISGARCNFQPCQSTLKIKDTFIQLKLLNSIGINIIIVVQMKSVLKSLNLYRFVLDNTGQRELPSMSG